jgi:hypothetical protein
MEESKEGIYDGDLVGAWLGILLGVGDAEMDEEDEGFNDGDDVGSANGTAVDGCDDGSADEDDVGAADGANEGFTKGDDDG